jgi:hypothetical protein
MSCGKMIYKQDPPPIARTHLLADEIQKNRLPEKQIMGVMAMPQQRSICHAVTFAAARTNIARAHAQSLRGLRF